jgi:prevent-host-death family protein
MAAYRVAEAKTRLSELIDVALEGEEVVITRHGRPVAEIRPVRMPAQPISPADLDWLAARQVGHAAPQEDAGRLLGLMWDEDER